MIDEARRTLDRVPGVHEVKPMHGNPDSVLVKCEPDAVRPVKTKMQRSGYSYQPRQSREADARYGDSAKMMWHVFKPSGGSRGHPRNSRDLTRAVQRGDFGLPGGRG